MFTPRSGVYTCACFPSCDGVLVSTRNELARHRVDTCGVVASQGDEPSERRLGIPGHRPVSWSRSDPCAPPGTRRSLGPAALCFRGRDDPVRAVSCADTAPPTEGSQVGGDVAQNALCNLLAKPPSRHLSNPSWAVSRPAAAGAPELLSRRS